MSTPLVDPRPLLVVVSSLSRSREYFFRSVSPHYRLWLLQGGAGRTDQVTWELPYLAGHTVVDTLDADAMTEAVRAIPERVAGILSYDEARIAATAVVAERFGPADQPTPGSAALPGQVADPAGAGRGRGAAGGQRRGRQP